jgi:hypothetical protein
MQARSLERGCNAIDYNNFCGIASKPKYISLFIWMSDVGLSGFRDESANLPAQAGLTAKPIERGKLA